MPTEKLPRTLGNYLLTAALGEDALGREYRALRISGEKTFVRLRLLESPELSSDALIDALEENGEVHGFLKNPAIARGVDMDAADGVPYIAWNEPGGRPLTALSAKCRALSRKVPVEHALLIVEKVATALDHAYNTSIDGDRTLHGLVWPGFVVISDDGEIRLAGFGLAEGVLPSLGRPRLAREIAPYVAPEERERAAVARSSDVFSVGVILLELLTGEPPSSDPLAALRGTGGSAPAPILPEIQAVLRMTLGPPENRYKSSGDLRRELGKLLFSGPYSPSTFNLAYFLNDLFRDEIEAETRARKREAGLDASASAPPARPAPVARPVPPEPVPAPRIEPPRSSVSTPASRGPLRAVGGLLAAAAVAGGIYVVLRRPPDEAADPAETRVQTVPPTRTLLPEFQATPSAPTSAMSEAQFRDEVSRRLAAEIRKLETQMKAAPAPARVALAPEPAVEAPVPPTEPVPLPTALPTAAPVEPERAPPTAVPAPTRVVVREGALVLLEDLDSAPRIATIVKPAYPPFALKAKIGGIVLLRVLVSEKGTPLQFEVLRATPGGLDAAAVEAVRKWTFTPGTKAGVAVRTWITVPIPFEP